MRDAIHRLFSYGTLRQRDVQRALFGRELEMQPDALTGYRLAKRFGVQLPPRRPFGRRAG